MQSTLFQTLWAAPELLMMSQHHQQLSSSSVLTCFNFYRFFIVSVGLFVMQPHDIQAELIHSIDLFWADHTESERLLAESMKSSAVKHPPISNYLNKCSLKTTRAAGLRLPIGQKVLQTQVGVVSFNICSCRWRPLVATLGTAQMQDGH